MKAVTVEQMRAIDARTIREAGVPGMLLMERAGAAVARAVQRLTAQSGLAARCLLVAGKGANGGDALVAARHLAAAGFEVAVAATCEASAWTGDAHTHFLKMAAAGLVFDARPLETDWENGLGEMLLAPPGVVVDGVLGTGLSGPARGVAARAIEAINCAAHHWPVVAIDTPSGLDADTGRADGPVVHADMTVTMGFSKRGFLEQSAVAYTGSVAVADIGIPLAYADTAAEDREMIAAVDMAGFVSPLAREAHKGSRGRVLIVAGSRGYAGAAVLATRAALRSGAGLVSVLTAQSTAPVVAGLVPEAMVHGGRENEAGQLVADADLPPGCTFETFDAVLAGPGLGVDPGPWAWIQRLLADSRAPVVLDADALTLGADRLVTIRQARSPVVVTPHPGEAARLLAASVSEVQANRVQAACRLAAHVQAVTVLKGAGTIVVEPDGHPHINLTGNPGMACGGTGDVLAGLLAGILAQGLSSFDAARLAVYVHGLAGDCAARAYSQRGMTAADVIDRVPGVWKAIAGR